MKKLAFVLLLTVAGCSSIPGLSALSGLFGGKKAPATWAETCKALVDARAQATSLTDPILRVKWLDYLDQGAAMCKANGQ